MAEHEYTPSQVHVVYDEGQSAYLFCAKLEGVYVPFASVAVSQVRDLIERRRFGPPEDKPSHWQ